MSSVTSCGRLIMATCELGTSAVTAPARAAIARWASGGIVASFPATMYQLGMARQPGTPEAVGDDAYAIAVWAHWATNAAEWAGDPAWALAITERWETADPHHLFINVDPYRRVSRCWARALTGDDPAAAAAEAEQVV